MLFFYPSHRLGISSAVRRYIIKGGFAAFVYHHAMGVYKYRALMCGIS